MGLTWLFGFGLVICLSLHQHLKERLRRTTSLMYWQIVMVAGVSGFVLLPYPLRWVVFLLAAARMVFEAIAIQQRSSAKGRAFALTISPLLPLVLFASGVADDAWAATLLLSFFLTEAFDSFSLLGGQVFGARPMAPRLSPNKTWEGFLAGAAVTLLIAVALVPLGAVTVSQAFICTAVTIVFATAGDLAASYGKRLAGVKDYPLLISGQGGLLDMLDSWIYVAPLTAFALRLGTA